ncbi:hypothetical protein ACEPAG_8304 [Sanghuangporus baumii]
MSPTGGQSGLNSTYGCLFLTVMLWAVSCIQLWFYIETYFRTDKSWLKIFAVLVWILDTVYLVLVLKFLYIYFVKEFGNVGNLDNLGRDIHGSAPFSPVIVGLVHFFYIMRAFNLSGGNYFLAGALALCSLAQLIVSSIYLHLVYVKPLSSILKFERAMNIIVLFTDTVLALSIAYFLWKLHVGFKRTDGVINILVAFTVGSGLIAGVMSIVAFVAAETMPQSFVYLLMDFCISKLYYNCVLASLNARSSLREDMNRTIMTQSLRLDVLVPAASDMLVTTTPAINAASSHKVRNPITFQSSLDIPTSSLSEAEIVRLQSPPGKRVLK